MSQASVSVPEPQLAKSAARIDSLDLLRGIAILGIFLMNTWTMSLPQAAYTNPASYDSTWVLGAGFPQISEWGERIYAQYQLTSREHWAYTIIHLFADMKFISTFSILFGAGIVLQAERARKKGRSPWATHYIRMYLLLAFGLVHTFGFWYGDILTDYAILGMLLAPLRKLPATLLLVLGVLLICCNTGIDMLRLEHNKVNHQMLMLTPEQRQQEEPAWSKTITYLDAQEYKIFSAGDRQWNQNITAKGFNEADFPTDNDQQLQVYRGGWWEQITSHRFWTSASQHTIEFIYWTFFRCGGCFLIGMALQKRRFFHAVWPKAAYATIAGFAIPIGWMVTYMGVRFNDATGWYMDQSNELSLWHLGVSFNYYGSIITCMGYLSLGVLLAIWAANPPAKDTRIGTLLNYLHQIYRACLIPIRSVGRMALTCYLTETLIGTTLFYGHGFGLFGTFSRAELPFKVVLPAWIGVLAFATLWLTFFRQGPLEWLWHSIAYWDWHNPLKSAAGPDASLSPNVAGLAGESASAATAATLPPPRPMVLGAKIGMGLLFTYIAMRVFLFVNPIYSAHPITMSDTLRDTLFIGGPVLIGVAGLITGLQKRRLALGILSLLVTLALVLTPIVAQHQTTNPYVLNLISVLALVYMPIGFLMALAARNRTASPQNSAPDLPGDITVAMNPA